MLTCVADSSRPSKGVSFDQANYVGPLRSVFASWTNEVFGNTRTKLVTHFVDNTSVNYQLSLHNCRCACVFRLHLVSYLESDIGPLLT